MWNNTQQDTSFAGDGGFSRDEGDQGGKNSKIQNLVHMHIADYLNQGEETLVCGQPVDMMVFCGKVDRIDPSAGMIEYEIVDSTGRMTLKSLVDAGRDENPLVNVASTIRAVCSPKSMSGQKTALVLKLFPLSSDPEEERRHTLRVKYDKLRIIEAGRAREQPTGNSRGGGVPAPAANTAPVESGPRGQVIQAFQQILSAMHDPDQGADVKSVVSALKGKLNPVQVKSIVDELQADGTLFSTLDENHFGLT